jgi:hypothetical protein
VLVGASGGVDGTYARQVHGAGVTSSYTDQHPVSYKNDFSFSPATIFSEQVFVVELDARTLSCAYEKRTMRHVPTEPSAPAYDLNFTSDYYTERFLGITTRGRSFGIVCGDQEVFFSEVWDTGGSLNTFSLRALSWHHQLIPRFHTQATNYEESTLGITYFYDAGLSSWAENRFWWEPFESHPIRLRTGQIQSRFDDVVISVADDVTRLVDRYNAGMGGTEVLRPPNIVNYSRLNSLKYEVEPALAARFISAGTPAAKPIRLSPIFAV